MSDPFSIASGVVGILSLGIQVTQGVFDYYNTFQSQYSDVNDTLDKTDALLGRLRQLREHLEGQCFREEDQQLKKDIEKIANSCEECIAELEDELQKFKEAKVEGVLAVARAKARRVAYPFRQSTLQKLEETVDDIMEQLSQALELLNLKNMGQLQSQMEDMGALLDLIRANQVETVIQNWLKAPDATINLNENCKKTHPGTGLWLTKGDHYARWLEHPGSFLWLVGFAGCGKSVLCSTAIQYAFRHRRSDSQIGVACFFFKFNDGGKQSASAVLRALVLQLSGQLELGDSQRGPLAELHAKYRCSSPTDEALLDCLHQLVRRFRDVYILLDALDESPRGRTRNDMLQILQELRAWAEPRVHLLVTSRDEVDIREELDASAEEKVPMRNESIDEDIKSYVSQHLRQNRRLRKWEEHFGRIEEELSHRAQGVWVICTDQLTS